MIIWLARDVTSKVIVQRDRPRRRGMITWLSRDITAKWLRIIVTGFVFSWLIWIAWWENRHYRNMTVLFTQQFETLRDDHVRAQALLKTLAEQVFKSAEAVKKSTEVIKELPDGTREHR